MTNCHNTKKMLSDYIEDVLDEKQRRHIDEHLASCAVCRALVKNTQNLKNTLHALPHPISSDSFDMVLRARLRQQIRNEKRSFSLPRLPSFFESLKAPAFAVFAVMLVFLGATLQRFYGSVEQQTATNSSLQAVSQDIAQNVNVEEPGYLVYGKLDTINNQIVIVNYLDIDDFFPTRDEVFQRASVQKEQDAVFPDLKNAPARSTNSVRGQSQSSGIQLAKEYVF